MKPKGKATKAIILKNFDFMVHKNAKIQAAREEITITALFEKAVREYLDKAEKKEK